MIDTLEALRIDTGAKVVYVNGAPVHLRPKEYELLIFLTDEPTRVYSDEQLGAAVWGWRACAAYSRTISSHTSRLRVALRDAGLRDDWISRRRGYGTRLLPRDYTAAQALDWTTVLLDPYAA